MILPTPYPNEMSFSVIMRFFKWYGLSTRAFTKLFGARPSYSGNIERQRFLKWCYENFYSNISFSDFLWKHTLHPIESYFFPQKYDLSTLEDIDDSVALIDKQNEAFMYSNRQPYYGFLRFCPHCWEEQRQKYGEAYWLRDWFVFGVSTCPKHHCKLLKTNTTVLTCSSFNKLPFPEKVEKDAVEPDDELCVPHVWQDQLAEDVSYILSLEKNPDWNWEVIVKKRLNQLCPVSPKRIKRGNKTIVQYPDDKSINFNRFYLTRFFAIARQVKNNNGITSANIRDLHMSPMPKLTIGHIVDFQVFFIENWLLRWVLFPYQSLADVYAVREAYQRPEDIEDVKRSNVLPL